MSTAKTIFLFFFKKVRESLKHTLYTTTSTLTMLNIILLVTLALPFASAVSGTLVFTSNRAPYPDHKKGQVCADGIEPWCRRQK